MVKKEVGSCKVLSRVHKVNKGVFECTKKRIKSLYKRKSNEEKGRKACFEKARRGERTHHRIFGWNRRKGGQPFGLESIHK